MRKQRIAILISGRGSNMAALIAACADADFPAEICLILSNRPEAGGLRTAQEHGIATAVVDHKQFATRQDFDAALATALQQSGADFVCLAGFMRLLGDDFVNRWRDRMINIHPSLLPAFKGLDTHRRAIDAGARITGCTVHFVRPEMDEGPIIAQAAVPVAADDTPDTLAARVLAAEHKLYPRALQLLASGQVRVVSEKVLYARPGAARGLLISPAYDD